MGGRAQVVRVRVDPDDQRIGALPRRMADEAAVTGPEVDRDRAVAGGDLGQSSTVDPVFFLALNREHVGKSSRWIGAGPATARVGARAQGAERA
jgi:hypothetical protein